MTARLTCCKFEMQRVRRDLRFMVTTVAATIAPTTATMARIAKISVKVKALSRPMRRCLAGFIIRILQLRRFYSWEAGKICGCNGKVKLVESASFFRALRDIAVGPVKNG